MATVQQAPKGRKTAPVPAAAAAPATKPKPGRKAAPPAAPVKAAPAATVKATVKAPPAAVVAATKAPPGRKAPPAPAAPKAPPAAPPEGPSDLAAARAEIARLTSRVESLMKAKAARPSVNGRLVSDILNKADGSEFQIQGDDWRNAWHGVFLDVRRYDGKGHDLEMIDGPPVQALIAIPRDAERQGAAARLAGLVAVWLRSNEEGDRYLGEPSYLSEAQLERVRV